MHRIVHLFILSFLVAACGSTSVDTPSEPGPPDDPIDPFVMKELMGAGINMGSSMEAPDEGEWSGGRISVSDFDRIKEKGFDAIRLPVRWYTHSRGEQIDEAWMRRVEQVVDQALERDFVVVLNQHHENELFDDPDRHGDRFIAFWEQIAERFQDRTHRLVFELLNEPHDNLGREKLNEIQLAAYDRIRVTNPTRIVIIGGAKWNNWYELINGVEFPEDRDYVMGHWHRYSPNDFTHQDEDETVTCCTAQQAADATAGFDEVAAWSEQTGIAVSVTEFGTGNAAPLQSRVNWMNIVMEQMKEKDFAPFVWSYHDVNFGLWDRTFGGRWTEPIIETLDIPYWEPDL